MTTQFHFSWNSKLPSKEFRTGISLHSHTMHSHENLGFLPRYIRKIPVVSQLVRAQEERYLLKVGRVMDYSTAYWTPPLPAREALDLERKQIERLGMHGLVSLTDHDSIEAPALLHVLDEAQDVPMSFEWSVPLGESFIHLGVHNLPQREAHLIAGKLAVYTKTPDADLLGELLEHLNTFPEVLVVFNHPLWDEARFGLAFHHAMARGFAQRYGHWLHAFELNGLRPWHENRAVIEFAKSHGKPLISGGDRHGSEPNANINLTNASTFSEFVDGIRSGASDVLFLPQYQEKTFLRQISTAWDIMREYPEYTGRRLWSDRVFFTTDEGEVKPLTTAWREGPPPAVIRYFIGTLRLFNCRSVRSALRVALADQEEVVL